MTQGQLAISDSRMLCPPPLLGRNCCDSSVSGLRLAFGLSVGQPPGGTPGPWAGYRAAAEARADRRMADICCAESAGAGGTGLLWRMAEPVGPASGCCWWAWAGPSLTKPRAAAPPNRGAAKPGSKLLRVLTAFETDRSTELFG